MAVKMQFFVDAKYATVLAVIFVTIFDPSRVMTATTHVTASVPRMFDGIKTSFSEYPFFTMMSSLRRMPLCGASFLSSKWIITAGHCLYARLLKAGGEMVVLSYASETGGDIIRHGSNIYHIHPKFSSTILSELKKAEMKADAGLVELAEPLDDVIANISLPMPFEDEGLVDSAKKVTVIGAGYPPQNLGQPRRGVLSFTNDPSCYEVSPNPSVKQRPVDKIYEFCISTNQTRTRLCLGDSGGPAFIRRQEKYVIVGVTSLARNVTNRFCVPPPHRLIASFTRVTRVISWILHALDTDESIEEAIRLVMHEWMSVTNLALWETVR